MEKISFTLKRFLFRVFIIMLLFYSNRLIINFSETTVLSSWENSIGVVRNGQIHINRLRMYDVHVSFTGPCIEFVYGAVFPARDQFHVVWRPNQSRNLNHRLIIFALIHKIVQRRTYRIRVSFVRKSFFEFHRTINVDVELVGQGEHVTGRTEFGQVTTSDDEFSPRLQTFCMHQLELDFSCESSHGVQAGRMQGNAEHVFLILLRQQ